MCRCVAFDSHQPSTAFKKIDIEMAAPVSKEHLAQLKVFTDLCIENPSILHLPDLAFVKTFIEHFGGSVPDTKSSNTSGYPKFKPQPAQSNIPEPEPAPESDESDIELDTTGVIEPDTDAPQKMGNPTLQPTEEEVAESQAKRSEAVSAFVENNYEKALSLYTEAIVLNPQASLLYAKRGQLYLMLNKPNACIRDCDRALEINPDSAAAHKFRGRAYRLLGKWEEAANDLRLACKIDFDEQADEWLREVTPNARKIEEHKRKQERKKAEKIERERMERLKKAREEAKLREDNTRPSQTEGSAPGAGGGGAPGTGDFYQFLKDPEVLQAFQDPEVGEAFKDISANPANILKYQSNPKIMALINKMASKFGGAGGGMPPGMAGMAGGMGGFPGMMGGMPGFGGTGAAPPTDPSRPKNSADDVGLD
ncbi:hsc70-interacting protein-like isoform X1 [Neodiprion virginianus]|nr:hsc70-interacting protein-like isoform X1 [Neodiprion virginianus]